MAEIIGVGQLSLLDLNDAIISGVPPKNPTVGSLWIDENLNPAMLKKWNGEAWIDLGELDPDLSVIIEDINETLGNMANDNLINFQERQVIKDKLTEIIGYVISDTATTLPTVATLDGSGKGNFWSVRKSARNVGIPTSHATYTNVATRYNNLKSYLESLTPIDVWDTRNANADVTISVTKSTFRDRWLQYYLAVDALSELTAKTIKDNEDALKDGVDEIGRDVGDLVGRVVDVESKVTDESIINRVTSSESWVEQINVINSKATQDDIDDAIDGLEIGGRNLIPYTDFSKEGMANNWFNWNSTTSASTNPKTVKITLDNGEVIPFMEVKSKTGLESGKSFGYVTRSSGTKFSVVEGEEYTLSFLVAVHHNTENSLNYTYLIHDNLSGNQGIILPKVTTQQLYGHFSSPFSLNVYKVSHTFKSKNTSSETRFLIGSRTAKNLQETWTGLFYVSRIILEKGNKATDWTPAPEDTEYDIEILGHRVDSVEQEITSDSIVTTITESTTFKNALDSKADVDSLGEFATKTEMDELEESIQGDIDDAIDGIDFEPYATKTELEETSRAITAKFSATGGMNLVKNSIGFAGLDFWNHVYSNTDTTTISNLELDTLGFGSAFYFPTSANKGIHQDIPVVEGQIYTMSWYLNKSTANGSDSSYRFYIQIQEHDGSTWVTEYSHPNNSDVTTNGYEFDYVTYTPTTDTIRIRFIAYANCEASLTGIMLNIGDVPLQWSLATGEMYNTNIKMDINGVRVSQLDENRREIGYTQITPDEFAGYYDTDGNGTFEKVFYLNGEETVTKKFRALNEITMGGIKIIRVDRSGNNGWAFVPIVE